MKGSPQLRRSRLALLDKRVLIVSNMRTSKVSRRGITTLQVGFRIPSVRFLVLIEPELLYRELETFNLNHA
jgi:hypothetical protein